MVVNKQLVKLQVDCGATVNVLPRRYVGNKEIRHEDVSLKMWNDVTMKAIGKCRVKTVNPVTGEKWKIDYVVVDQDLIPLFSRKAVEKMKLITINYDNFESVSAVSTSLKTSDVVNEFPKVFANKLGSLPAKNVQTQAEFETINAITFLPMREESISKIRDETERDESLQTLKRVIQQGWPHDKANVPYLAAPYYYFIDELAVTDGLIFRGERLVIPGTMRSEIKKNMHLGHTGIEGCLRRARESLYWPGMTSEIKEWIKTCETCQEYDNSQTKETLMSHDMPDRPWQNVGVHLFSYMGKDYLVTTDYKSNFWEIDYLSNTSSKSVITKLKAHFARMCIPDTVVSDNGPQFSSSDFAHFSKKWGFEHTPSSPHHSRSNGKVESSVKSAKKMMRKAKKCGEDQYLALLNIRNIPSQGMDSSPAQRLLGRRTKAIIPTARSLLESRFSVTKQETDQLKMIQRRQARYYDRSARDLPTLHEGDTVRMKPFRLGDKSWKKAKVVKRLDDRSYEVEDTDGTVYRRNRVHLKKTCDAPPSSGMPLAEPPVENTPPTPGRPPPQNVARNSPPSSPRRSSRTTNVPAKYKDFVLSK